MKQEQFFLVNQEVRKNIINRILDLECDGKIKITISNAGTKTDKQRSLDWKWDNEIFKSGKGWHDDTVEKVHARSKWMFAKPIWLRDDDVFPGIYKYFMDNHGKDPDKCLKFARDFISTERLSQSQAWEYMNNKQNYWLLNGVNLTDPKDYGLEFYYTETGYK